MRNRRKSYKKWIVLAALILVVGVGAYLYLSGTFTAATPDARTAMSGAGDLQSSTGGIGSYSAVTRGSITKTVYGSGNLSSASNMTVYSGAPGRVSEVAAEVGDQVNAGDVILRLSSDDLETEIASLENALFTQQVALSEVRDSGTTGSVYAPATGRIKLLKAEEDDDVETIMKRHGYLCVISRDGKMRVEFEPATALAVGDYVTVWIDGTGLSGRVSEVSGLQGKVAATIDDDSYDVGKEVSITTPEGDKLGSGVLQVNMPIPVTAVGGTIDTVYYDDNDKITSGSRIFYLTGRTPSSALKTAYLSYEEARIALEKAQNKLDSLIIRAPYDGVITEMAAAIGAPMEENAQAFVIQSSSDFKLVATVDELDIAGVEAGQAAIVEFDAYPDKEYPATVKRVSGLGTVSGGVATYEVTLSLENADGLLDGMTASADIVVANKEGVLLVPVEAVSTSGGRNYVTLSDGTTSIVETGVSDDTNIEIISGVNEGDSVMVVKSGSSSSETMMGFPGGGMSMGGMAMPSGSMGGNFNRSSGNR